MSQKSGDGQTVRYDYNAGNAVAAITYPNRKAVDQGYDADGRLGSATVGASAGASGGVSDTLVFPS